MAGFVLPRTLVESVHRYPYPGRAEWLAALPDVVGSLARGWSLRRPGGVRRVFDRQLLP